jgi:CheY-like chemotaxis protein
MRILAVDDEPSILELLTTFLEAEDDNEILTASSGEHALAIIETAEKQFDCILVDIQMPEMNGIALCENIRAVPGYFHVPIIMLTAMSQKSYIEKAFSVGATDYVTKPFDFLELRCRLKAAAKIVFEYKRACDVADTARQIILDTGSENKPHPDEPLLIDNVDRVVGYTAFENYVLAMSRAKLLFATTFAVRIRGFSALHDMVSTRELRSTLAVVAEAVSELAPGAGNLISYRGGGVFLCFKLRKTSTPHAHRIMHVGLSQPYGTAFLRQKSDVQVVVGEEISLVSISKTGVLMALRRAIDVLDNQPFPDPEEADPSRSAVPSQTLAAEKTVRARQAYELVLQEIMREEGRKVG